MGNIAPRVAIKPTPLAFRARVLTISPRRLPDVTMLPVPTCLCGSLPEKSVQTTTTSTTLLFTGDNTISWVEQTLTAAQKAPVRKLKRVRLMTVEDNRV